MSFTDCMTAEEKEYVQHPITKYSCKMYGKRWVNWPICQPCPEKICEGCSIETLSIVFNKRTKIITTQGNTIIVGDLAKKELSK